MSVLDTQGTSQSVLDTQTQRLRHGTEQGYLGKNNLDEVTTLRME